MKPTTCIHFTGVQHDACAAGVRYDSLDPRGLKSACLSPAATCGSRVYPTPEEIAADTAAWEITFQRVDLARAAIVARHGKARGLASEMPCPACNAGTLRYSIASNGHIHAACSAGCCSWME